MFRDKRYNEIIGLIQILLSIILLFALFSFNINDYQNLVQRALINPLDIAYFLGLVFIFLFLATQVLSTRRWSS